MNANLESGSFFCGIPIFTYSELQEATNKFNMVLGDGGFGIVYYGKNIKTSSLNNCPLIECNNIFMGLNHCLSFC